MTDAITTTGTTGTTGTTSTSSTTSDNGLGKDTFLKLLVAQLKYQNPLQPADGAQYMAQMAQFTQVEKLADLQTSQASLLSWQRTVAGQGMIGKNISATLAATGETVTGKVTGMKLTDAGPRLVLDDGTTVSVDEITDVDEGPVPSSGTSTSTSGSTSSSTGSTTSGTSTGSTTTGSTTATTGATGSTTSTTGATTGTGTGTTTTST